MPNHPNPTIATFFILSPLLRLLANLLSLGYASGVWLTIHSGNMMIFNDEKKRLHSSARMVYG